MTLEELLGRKTAQHENLQVEYSRLLDVLGQVLEGTIHPSRVMVDRDRQSWSVGAPAPVDDASEHVVNALADKINEEGRFDVDKVSKTYEDLTAEKPTNEA